MLGFDMHEHGHYESKYVFFCTSITAAEFFVAIHAHYRYSSRNPLIIRIC